MSGLCLWTAAVRQALLYHASQRMRVCTCALLPLLDRAVRLKCLTALEHIASNTRKSGLSFCVSPIPRAACMHHSTAQRALPIRLGETCASACMLLRYYRQLGPEISADEPGNLRSNVHNYMYTDSQACQFLVERFGQHVRHKRRHAHKASMSLMTSRTDAWKSAEGCETPGHHCLPLWPALPADAAG